MDSVVGCRVNEDVDGRTDRVIGVESHSPTSAGLADRVRSRAGSAEVRKMLRYAGVSAIFVPLGQVFLQLVIWIGNLKPTVANLVVASLLTPFNFAANKYWVWRNQDRERIRTQAVVFWVMALAGVLVSTLFIGIADSLIGDHPSKILKSFAWFIAALLGYGIVWATRYVVLDRIVFAVTHHHISEVDHPSDLDDLGDLADADRAAPPTAGSFAAAERRTLGLEGENA